MLVSEQHPSLPHHLHEAPNAEFFSYFSECLVNTFASLPPRPCPRTLRVHCVKTQAHRPTVAAAHHLIPRRRGRLISNNTLLARATGAEVPALTSSGGRGEGDKVLLNPLASLEFSVMSPRAPQRECCPYLFQRGMVVSEEGVRGGQDHLRCEEVGKRSD